MILRPPRVVSALVAVLLIVTAVIILKPRANTGTNRHFVAKPGPWGKLECVHIAIEMPEAFTSLEEVKNNHAHWYFKQQSRDEIVSLFKSANLTGAQLNTLTQDSKWENGENGFWISPSDEIVLSMSQSARQIIYSRLARFPENVNQSAPFAFRADRLNEMLQHSGLADETIRGFQTLLYEKRNLKLFSDLDIFVNHLSNRDEKIRFLKTITRASTLLVKLHVDENSAIEELVDYWSYGGRKKDVRALLQSMAAVPGGCSVDIAHLLPSFVRQHIYTYPLPNTVNVTNQHCHWTSMNFLNDVPDDRFATEDFVRKTLGTEFMPVNDAPRLGDIFFFVAADGSVIHSATFIADNIVFTKNGGAPNRPWIYMELEDLMACYLTPEEPVQLMRVRRKRV